MSHVGWRGEQNTIYKRVETFQRGSPKRTILASSRLGLGPLQMVSESDIGPCTSEEAVSSVGVPVRTLAPKGVE